MHLSTNKQGKREQDLTKTRFHFQITNYLFSLVSPFPALLITG